MERQPTSGGFGETLAALFMVALVVLGLNQFWGHWFDLGQWLPDPPSRSVVSSGPRPGGPAPDLPPNSRSCKLQHRKHAGTKPGEVQDACLRAKAYAHGQVTASQWRCLDRLWISESNWDAWAVNRSSGAFGIPQILPAAHGRPRNTELGNWKGQVDWGLNYIERRYDTPCEAWRFWQRHSPHWY